MTYSNRGREPMDEKRLAEQLKKTGNLMDLTFDPQWQAEAADDDGWVEAGSMMQPYSNYLKSLTPEQHRSLRLQAQLLAILLPELKRWVESWGLGLSFEPVHLTARKMLYQHLSRLIAEQKDWIATLIDENNQHPSMKQQAVQSQTISILSQLFTAEDWRKLADIAAEGMSQTVLQISQAASEKIPATA